MFDILIIGSEGFIGNHLVKFYSAKGWNVTGIDRIENPLLGYNYFPVSKDWDVSDLLTANRFHYVVNAAGTGNVNYSIEHPIADFLANCFDTTKILNALRTAGSFTRYLHISSAAIYGNPTRLPVEEDDEKHPMSPYGWHKLISEIICREYHELYGINCCIARPFSVYGPGLRKQLFWDIHQKAKANLTAELFGTGKESRDFIYITDLIDAFDLLLTKAPMQCEAYNIASGEETTIHEIATKFLSNFSPPVPVNFNGLEKIGDPLNWKADISKISSLGFQSKITIEEGISNTFNWIQNIASNDL